jgi:hypothetical protein
MHHTEIKKCVQIVQLWLLKTSTKKFINKTIWSSTLWTLMKKYNFKLIFSKKKKHTTINDTQIDDIWTNTSTQTVSFWIQIRVRVRVLWIFLINQSTTLQQCFPFVLCLWSAPQCFALRARFLLPSLFFLGSPALSVFVLSVYRRRLLFPHHHSLSCVVVVVVVVFDIAFFFFFSVY